MFGGDLKEEEVATRPSKFSDFKPIQSAKTPVSMMQDHMHNVDPYRDVSRGVVPGYQGHVPRARDAFGTSAVGGLAPDINVGTHKHLGAMTGHSPGDVVLGREPPDAVFPEYQDKKRGVMPGYAGFRPGSRECHGLSAYGGIERKGLSGQGSDLKPDWDGQRMSPGTDYRETVNGVVPGYTGHVPLATLKTGTSHWGKPQSGAQTGHAETGIAYDKAFEVSKMTKAGYSGHIPGARDTYGTTVCNAE